MIHKLKTLFYIPIWYSLIFSALTLYSCTSEDDDEIYVKFDGLSAKTVRQIRKEYIYTIYRDSIYYLYQNGTLNEEEFQQVLDFFYNHPCSINVVDHLGNYNGYAIVGIGTIQQVIPEGGCKYIIEGIEIRSDAKRIYAWKPGQFYEIDDAYKCNRLNLI